MATTLRNTPMETVKMFEGAADAWTAAAVLLESGMPANAVAETARANATTLREMAKNALERREPTP